MSPMPFGWGAADSIRPNEPEQNAAESPMPFGWGAADSDLSPPKPFLERISHQCLSAGGLLTPILQMFGFKPSASRHQCLSAGGLLTPGRFRPFSRIR